MSESPDPPEWLMLDGGERIRLRESPSSNLVLASLAAGTVLLIVMSVLVGAFADVTTGRAVSFAVLVLVVGLLLAAYVVIWRREYVLTSEGAYAGVGLTDKRVSSVDLGDVRDVTVEQSDWQRLVGVGTLRFVTDGDGEVRFALVENPMGVHRQVLQFVDLDGSAGAAVD